MIEITDNLDILTRPVLDLNELTLAGVRYGAPASSIPLARICEVTLAPIAASYNGRRYWDAQGKELSLAEVIQDAIANGGILHFPEEVSFRVAKGKVDRFSIHSATMLKDFSHLNSQDEIERVFGVADKIERDEIDVGVFDYLSYYTSSKKQISWNPEEGISLINLGSDS